MRLPWHQLDDIQKRTVHLGPNVKKLMIRWASALMVPPKGEVGDVIDHLTNPGLLKAKMQEALDKTMAALDAVKAAPDNIYGDDDEAIAGEIMRQIDAKKSRTVLKIGTRKEGVPSQEEMYRSLKERSIQLQSASQKR